MKTQTRRVFLRNTALAGAGLCLWASDVQLFAAENAPVGFRPNAYIRIAPDGQITFWVTRCEMGQGVRTLLPMMIAEELEVDYGSVRLEQPLTAPEFKGIRLRTSGSGSAAGTWLPIRRAASGAREMLLTAAAQRWNVSRDSCKAEHGAIVHSSTGRKLGYGQLAAQAAQLPVPQEGQLKLKEKDFRLIGGRHKRIDGNAIVTGKLKYGLDFRVPGMKFAVIARSPVLGGKVKNFNADAVKKLPGVHHVVPITAGHSHGIAVTADSTWTALKARELLKIDWEPGEHANFSTELHYSRLREALKKEAFITRDEDEAQKPESTRSVTEAHYEWPYQAHACLEPMNCTAHVKGARCEIWVPTQAPERSQEDAAKLLGIPPENVLVHAEIMGGGFGRRLFVDYVVEAVELAKSVPYPVQVVWTREEDMKNGYFNPAAFMYLRAELDERKRPTRVLFRSASSDLSVYTPTSTNNAEEYAEGFVPWGLYDQPYKFAAFRSEYAPVESPVPTGPWRAVGYPCSVLARECFIDELAINAGADPIAFRLELLQPGDTVALGMMNIDRSRLIRVLESAREISGWSKPLTAANGWRAGRGIACNVYHGGTHIATVAEVVVGPQGEIKVERLVTVLDLGQPLNMLGIEGQVESAAIWALSSTLKSGMEFKNGQAVSSSFRDYPVIRMNEAPRIETHVLPGTGRPHGLGEQPVPVVAPAVANAIFTATGKRFRRVPILKV